MFGVYWHGLGAVLGDPGRPYRVVFRSVGTVAGTDPGSTQRASNLSMLESTPLLGAALAVPVGVVLSRFLPPRSVSGSDTAKSEATSTDGGLTVRRRVPTLGLGGVRRTLGRPAPTDWFLLAVSVLLALVYVSRLPVQGQITMRYLTPLYVAAVYAVCTHRLLGAYLARRLRTVAYAYEATVLVGVPATVAAMMWLGLGEAATFDALAGVAAGTTTGFVLLSQLVLFHYGVHLLPVIQAITEALRHLLVRMTV
ncbi:MAG: hypothetical protein V5A44_01505 [Haloarculaceae archaeon]